MGPKPKSRVTTISKEEGRKEASRLGFKQHLLPDLPFPFLSHTHISGAPFQLTAKPPLPTAPTLHKGHSSPPWHLRSLPLPEELAGRHTPDGLRAPLRAARGAPTPLGREPGHPSSEAGTAAPGPSHRKPPPPGARAAPPPAHPAPLAARPASRARLPRPPRSPPWRSLPAAATEAAPNSYPLPPSTARNRVKSRGRARSSDPEEAGRAAGVDNLGLA